MACVYIRIDTFYATTWNCRPRFPFVQPLKDLTSTLNSFPLLSNFDLKLLNLRAQIGTRLGVYEALQVLRILTVVRFADPVSVFNRMALSDAIYIIEWQLLPTQQPQNAFINLNFSPVIPEAFRLAAFLYIDMVLREMHSINIGGLVRRLIDALQGAPSNSFQELIGMPDNKLLLWILFIGGVASKKGEEREYFVQRLGCICSDRTYQSRADFEEAVDKVGPGLQSFTKQSAEIWIEMWLL
jgi:hypothetical protein